MIAKRLEGIKNGQEVYIVPSDTRCKAYWTEVLSVGPEKIIVEGTPDLREFDTYGRSIKWEGWNMYLSKEHLDKELELRDLKYKLKISFDTFVNRCEDLEKIRGLVKHYSEYYGDELPF